MTPDQWRDLLNLGLPTVALAAIALAAYKGIRWISVKIVEPFMGADGIIHRYFKAQREQYERQGDIAERHQELTEELSKTCAVHHQESHSFFNRSDITIAELVEAHSHVVTAMRFQFNDEQAIKELEEADRILRRHLKP